MPTAPPFPSQTVLVTGGTKGIGNAIAAHLSGLGARVFAAAIDAPPPLQLDVRSEQSVDSLFRHIESAGCALTSLIHCAGVGVFKPIADLSLADWDLVLSTNLTGAFLCTRAAIRHMLARSNGGGRIVHIGSVADHTPLAANGAYGSSKAGLRMLTQVTNEECALHGIRATLLSLGAVYTDVWASRPEFDKADMLSPADVAGVVAGILSQPPHVRVDELTVKPPKGIL